MKHYQFVALIVFVLLMACGSFSKLSSPATSTPLPPSNTPEPTYTALPTATAVPSPTSTPDAAATEIAQATETASDTLAELDQLLGTDSSISYKDGHLAWQQNEQATLKLTGPDKGFITIDDKLTTSDFIFKADVTWEATGILICGAVFRSEPNLAKGKQYMFSYLRLSGLPAWEIDVNEFGRFKNSPSKFQTSGALDLSNGSTNSFVIAARDNEFTVYINRVREGRFYDNSRQRSNGVFGFYGVQESGKGTCEFKNAWVWSLDK
jgi:hypothetical protein